MGKQLEIGIERLKARISVGIYDAEKKKLQVVFISAWLKFKSAPIEKDEMRFSVDYDVISSEIRSIANARHYELIENLAYHIAGALKKLTKCHDVRVRIDKPLAAAKNEAETIFVSVA